METHYLGDGGSSSGWELSKVIGKLKGVSVSCGCWASSTRRGSRESERDVRGEEEEEKESSDSEDEEDDKITNYEENYDIDDGTHRGTSYNESSNKTKANLKKK